MEDKVFIYKKNVYECYSCDKYIFNEYIGMYKCYYFL